MISPPDPTLNDLARLYAVEHMVRTLWYMESCRVADREGVTVETAARQYAEAVKASLVEGQIPRPLLDLIRMNAAAQFDQVVETARTSDILSGRGGA